MRRGLTKALLAGALALGGLAAGGAAHAQSLFRTEGQYATSQNFALEVRFSPYSPDIDEEFDGAAQPHKAIFGTDRRLMVQGELDWQILRLFGSLGVGLQVGYFRETANAPILDEAGNPTGVLSGDKTKLVLAPVSALAVYRLDEGLRRYGVPLVPYGKIGLNYTFWWTYDGGGDVSSTMDGGEGSGGSLGWQTALGLSLALDWLEPDSAHSLDEDSGINHSYVFFELNHVEAPGFGQKDALHVGDTTWTLGLAFEF